LILDYGVEESLEVLQQHAGELAAVMVEPVQSRCPELQPWEFLRSLRTLTADAGVALIFDEIVTGFRAHPAGVQGILDIKADLATYGKAAGGGLPMGLVAGSSEYMDALDGGMWEFGDDSFPEAGVTMFAGTFIRHPLALAAAKATLEALRDAGPQFQQDLTARTKALADGLNEEFEKFSAPYRASYFSSLFYVQSPSSSPHSPLLFSYLRSHGVHIWDRPSFLTAAHTDADIETIIGAFRTSLAEMRSAGLIQGSGEAIEVVSTKEDTVVKSRDQLVPKPPVHGAQLGRTPEGELAWFVADPDRPGKYLQVNADV
jgi:glutamate-1-semialdehyde aminotransferase